MTMLHDAAKQALDVLQGIIDLEEMPYDPFSSRDVAYQHFKAIQDLRDALAEPDGWRQCAVGQKTTQYCGLLEDAVKAERAACAHLCIEVGARQGWHEASFDMADACAAAIRERGNDEP